MGYFCARRAVSRPSTSYASPTFGARLRDVALLFKLRLSGLVVFSALLGYQLGWTDGGFDPSGLLVLALAGLLVTGASNAFNQVLEVDTDALMARTADRPLVRGTMTMRTAMGLAMVAGIGGVALLWAAFGPLTAILGMLSLVIYVALYTPLKRHTPWAVLVGAFPGAFPPMLGYVAATGHFGLGPGLLFAMQFMWQFPHFWSIAWLVEEDYARAGFQLLPSREGAGRQSAFLILVYTLFVIPVGMLPWVFGLTGRWSMWVAVIAGAWMLWPALRLFRSLDRQDARRLMFASFLYLPVVQLAYVFDRQ
ncbi:MAG: protoheme IX farnesyltransferase [Flavobacteriales bacterium]|nr:protoheme IX farnesyltransferase [Flavobacteriales bacterium]MCB9193412.1 protoheme IX farnesyltransferase [Flavobacteriales bacterium]